MSLRTILNVSHVLRVQSINSRRLFASESKDDVIAIAEEKPIFVVQKEDDSEYQEELAKKQNKSRLAPGHRNMLFGVNPYKEPMEWYHSTVKYKRRMLGRYGMEAVGMTPGVAWPSPKELEDIKEYERVAFPVSLQERWKTLAEERRIRQEERLAREIEVESKMKNMKKWINEVKQKVHKKEEEVKVARERKERLIEEVRQHFGFKISVHDEKFKEMLAKKEKEDKKKSKEARKAARAEKLAQKVAELYKAQGIPVDGKEISPDTEATKVETDEKTKE